MREDSRQILLLGAGASVPLKIPSAARMVEELFRMAKEEQKHDILNVLSYVQSRLTARQRALGSKPTLNVEELFRAIEGVVNREQIDAPFALWERRVDQLDAPTVGLLSPYFEARDLVPWPEYTRPLTESGIADQSDWWQAEEHDRNWGRFEVEGRQIVRKTFVRIENGVFAQALSWMIARLFNMTFLANPMRVDYFGPLAVNAAECGATIVTLNYDNAVEMGCRMNDVRPETGVGQWWKTRQLSFAEGLPIIKLHGSVEWPWVRLVRGDRQPRGDWDPGVPVKSIPLAYADFGVEPAVVFGQRNKLTAYGPFLDLYQEFKTRLNASRDLRIVGYSFADDHINEVIQSWLEANRYRKLRIYDISPVEEIKGRVPSTIRSNEQFQVKYYSANASEVLPKMYRWDDWG